MSLTYPEILLCDVRTVSFAQWWQLLSQPPKSLSHWCRTNVPGFHFDQNQNITACPPQNWFVRSLADESWLLQDCDRKIKLARAFEHLFHLNSFWQISNTSISCSLTRHLHKLMRLLLAPPVEMIGITLTLWCFFHCAMQLDWEHYSCSSREGYAGLAAMEQWESEASRSQDFDPDVLTLSFTYPLLENRVILEPIRLLRHIVFPCKCDVDVPNARKNIPQSSKQKRGNITEWLLWKPGSLNNTEIAAVLLSTSCQRWSWCLLELRIKAKEAKQWACDPTKGTSRRAPRVCWKYGRNRSDYINYSG